MNAASISSVLGLLDEGPINKAKSASSWNETERASYRAGDRQFTKWKGSVVDSIVGAFLTQNVSDHLSRQVLLNLSQPSFFQRCS
jgi:hypothetical protein